MPTSLGCRENQGFAETYPRNPKVVSDMTSLHHINEPAILYNLGERAKLKDQRPYTFMVSWYQGALIVRQYPKHVLVLLTVAIHLIAVFLKCWVGSNQCYNGTCGLM